MPAQIPWDTYPEEVYLNHTVGLLFSILVFLLGNVTQICIITISMHIFLFPTSMPASVLVIFFNVILVGVRYNFSLAVIHIYSMAKTVQLFFMYRLGICPSSSGRYVFIPFACLLNGLFGIGVVDFLSSQVFQILTPYLTKIFSLHSVSCFHYQAGTFQM